MEMKIQLVIWQRRDISLNILGSFFYVQMINHGLCRVTNAKILTRKLCPCGLH